MILTLDFGGTKNACALFSRNEEGAFRVERIERRASPPHPTFAYDYAAMLDMARSALRGRTPDAVGVSFGGPVRAGQGLVVLSHHVDGWEDVPLVAKLENEFGARVVMDNDANVAALGETVFGAGKGCASVLYLTVSTGIGGGWVLNGEIYRGASELAGEIGHVVIDPNGPPCVCGRRGCLEQLACGPAIARIAREQLQADATRGKAFRERIENDLSQVTALLLNQAATEGDGFARAQMNNAARALGFALGNTICLMNPERIILGGGVSQAGDYFYETLREAARSNTMPQLRDAVDIVPAALPDTAPLWGALALASQ